MHTLVLSLAALAVFALVALVVMKQPGAVGTVLETAVGKPAMFGMTMDIKTIQDLQSELVELNNHAQAIQAKADQEGRDLTDDEQDEITRVFNNFEQIEGQIQRRERIAAQADRLNQPGQRRSEAPDPADTNVAARAHGHEPQNRQTGSGGGRIQILEDPQMRARHGFHHFGEFAMAVRNACAPGSRQVDNRLEIWNAPSTYGNEGVGEDGGFAVPPEFRTDIMEKVQGEDQLLSRTDQLMSSSNAIVVPTDETTPWQTSGGMQSYWEGEADQFTQSKPKLNNISVRLNKLTTLIPVTNELLEDAPAMDGYLRRKAPQKMNFKINRAVIAGSGAGEPLGLLNSPALVTVAAESGPQTADTIIFENLVKMWSRMYGGNWSNAVWLANQDTLPQLLSLGFPTSATAVPVFMPPGGLADSPFGRLLGRPIIFTEACNTLGDKGDILLVDMTQYMTALKAGGIRVETSMHLHFDYDMMAFRFILRVAGHPWWSNSISPRSGSSNTLSAFVTLAERS